MAAAVSSSVVTPWSLATGGSLALMIWNFTATSRRPMLGMAALRVPEQAMTLVWTGVSPLVQTLYHSTV